MQVIATITQQEVIRPFLKSIGLPPDPPPILPARSPPSPDYDFASPDAPDYAA